MNELTIHEENRQQINQTPIEIALQMDEKGMVSAKKLYVFLGFDSSHFARWCKDNITENPMVQENVDYIMTRHYGETPMGGKITRIDYKLTVGFAKELCMAARSKRAKECRQYFMKTEEALKLVMPIIQSQAATIEAFASKINDLTAAIDSHNQKLDDHNARLALIDGGSKFVTSYAEKWVNDTFEQIKELAAVYTNGNYKACIGALIKDSHKWLDESYNEYARAYKLKYPQDINPYRLRVVAEFDDFREAFENALLEQLYRFNLMEKPKKNQALENFYSAGIIEADSDF